MALLLDCCLQIQQNAHMTLLKHFLELKRTSNLAQLHFVKASREYSSRLLICVASILRASVLWQIFKLHKHKVSRYIYMYIYSFENIAHTPNKKHVLHSWEFPSQSLTSFHRSAHRICTRDCKKKAVGVACLIWAWTEILHIAIPPLHLGLHVHDFHLLFLIKILFHYFLLLLLLSLDPLNPQYSIQIP